MEREGYGFNYENWQPDAPERTPEQKRTDRHHILFSQAMHSIYPQGVSLRGEPALIPRMYQEPHRELHRHIPIVPPIPYYGLMKVRRDFVSTGDTFQDISQLQRLIEVSSRHPRTHEIEKGMGQLTIQALELQIPFLKDGMVR